MHTNLLWAGREYNSLENCLLKNRGDGYEITSSIVGSYQDRLYRVEYAIYTNGHWQTTFFQLKILLDGKPQIISYRSDGRGNWEKYGASVPAFDGCTDIDISLTPFTNTLPVRRLQLAIGDRQIIKVLYLDILAGEIKPVQQQYERLSPNSYRYQNVPNDYEAVIEVDDDGLVTDYPGLFMRQARVDG